KKAAHFFVNSQDRDEPFILHNVDVISTIDLRRMLDFHNHHRALATLAVQGRKTSRYLLFDDNYQLCGRRAGIDGALDLAVPCTNPTALAFSGIHVISPRFLRMMIEEGAFSIITTYLRLVAAGERILGFRVDEYDWRDLGTPENLALAAEDIVRGRISA
ncbi:MAG TPA: hypothetical protein VGU90_14525, partial [Terriglobales bacterium]|nr:hypothetical protein [Terriglobales bacterium]